MKLNAPLKLPTKISHSLVLHLLLLAVILLELYLVYARLFGSFNLQANTNIAGDIVRVDLPAYTQTVQTLQDRSAFTPGPVPLANPSPFNYQ
jgi:hypothetical protein